MSLNSNTPQEDGLKHREASMIAKAQRAVFACAQWLTTPQLSELLGLTSVAVDTKISNWKSNKQIFSIVYDGIEYFPSYALSPSDSYCPVSILSAVMSLFADSKDSWGLAYWFASANGYLGGKRPQEILLTDPDSVLDAAKDELIGISHG